MKSISTLLVMLFLLVFAELKAQTVVINTGTAGTPDDAPGPIYRSSASSGYDASRYSYLYTEDELSAVGIVSGSTISQLGWTKSNNTTTTGPAEFRIYMKNSTTSSYSNATETWTNIINGATMVYESTSQQIPATVAPDYITFPLGTPFVYTGGSLEISTEWDISGVSGNPATGDFKWLWSTVVDRIYGTGNTSLSGTGTLSSTSNSINSIDNQRPFIQITYTPGSACTSPPIPGSAEASPSGTLCPNSVVTLSLTGNSSGSGQEYRWQRFTTPGGPYTYISAASPSPTYQESVASTGFYRAEVFCGGSYVYSDSVEVVIASLFPAGTYTIDSATATGGTNFQSFVDAVNAIKCGIAGQVVFNVVPGSGPYTEQVVIDSIPGTSATSRVIFNGNGDTLAFLSTNTNERAGIKLNGADFITIKNLEINSTSTTTGTSTTEYGFGIHLLNDADNNIIDSCIIRMNVGNSGTAFSGIAISGSNTSATSTGSNSDSNMISNNIVIGGNAGITLLGSSSMPVYNNTIINNTIQDFDEDGIYLSNANSTRVEGNDISKPTRSNTAIFTGIYMTSLSENNVIEKNRIHDPFLNAPSSTSTTYGLYITGSDVTTAGNENIIANNVVYNFNAGGTQYGIYNSSSDGVKYYHNTIDLSDVGYTGTSITRGFGQFTTADNIQLINNIITISRGGTGDKHVLYFGATTTASTITSDYNDLYISSTGGTVNAIGYLAIPATSYTTLADWQAASGQDANSLSVNPAYGSAISGDLEPTVAALDNKGMFVGITTDIRDTTRSATNPDMGAYEFSITACATPPTPGTIVASMNGVCPGTDIQLALQGNSVGIGQSYYWQSATSMNGPFTNIGNELSIPDTTVSPTDTTYYRVAVTCSGVTTYSDTLELMVNAPLGNVSLTINSMQPTSGTNYASFADAVFALRCGVSGPVEFNVVPGSGPYNEQVLITPVTGASATNRITFNGNGDTLSFNSNTSANRGGIKLDGADYITIKNLVIQSTSTTTGSSTTDYGFGIHMLNGADHNVIDSCTIMVNKNNTSTGFGGIVMSGSATSGTSTGSDCDSNRISNNLIVGGNWGITAYGSSSSKITGNVIINNTIQDFDEDGIVLSNNDLAMIAHNDISRPTRTAFTTFTGIYVTASENLLISKNRIHDPFAGDTSSGSTSYGIYFTSSDATPGNENIVANNAVYNFIGGGSQYGIYNSGSDSAFYYHNTVTLDDTLYGGSSITRAFYQTSTASGIDVKNNNFSITRTSSGANYVMYFNAAASTITSDYNNLYIGTNTGSTNAVGYNGTAQPTLSDWQTATAQDANSLSVDPMFVDAESGDLTPTNSALDDKGTPLGILTDINDMPRSASVPDIGAVEFTISLPVTLLNITATAKNTDAVISWTTSAEVNFSHFEVERSNTGSNFEFIATVAANGISSVSNKYAYTDESALAQANNLYYRLKMVNKDGSFTYSKIVLVKSAGVLEEQITVYPNPIKNEVFIKFDLATKEKVNIRMVDQVGRPVANMTRELQAGNTIMQLPVASSLPKGVYLVIVEIAGKRLNYRLLK